jgi:glycosyltransferase involved in cell wall biosynthesis
MSGRSPLQIPNRFSPKSISIASKSTIGGLLGMNVLHLCAGNLFGGIETYLVTLAKTEALHPQMHHAFALCFDGRLATDLRAIGGEVHLIGEVRTRKPWTVWQARQQLRHLLQNQSFDVVICHACWPQALFGSVVQGQKIPLVFSCHDFLRGHHWLERWAKWTIPDLTIANSHYTQTSLTSLYPQVPSHVAYLPVSNGAETLAPDTRDQVRRELQTSASRAVIIQACRLERWKGHGILIAALGQLPEGTDWEFWLVGGVQRPQDTAYQQELQAQVMALGLGDRVKFLGHRTDVPRLLAAADIHCQPNTSAEPFGIAFIEALYAGLPVVTSALGGAQEIIDSTCGYLVQPNDSAALAQCLETLLTNAIARQRLGSAGPARARALCQPEPQLRTLQTILSQAIAPQSYSGNPTEIGI